jgi:diguanylate cyclase (GGDEF)-like protein
MRHPDDIVDAQKVTEEAESKTSKLFWGSLLLSTLVIVHLLFTAKRGGGVLATIGTFLPAVLLWSLVMTAYAFYSLNSLARMRGERLSRAFTDIGTGVFTLAYLKSCLVLEHRRALELGTGAAVAYVDMMNLERVNRMFGHTVGDIVLRAVAQVIAASTRPGDIAGRVGGDEFLIIMPETTIREANAVAAKLCKAIAAYRLDLGKRGMIDFLNGKVGLAAFPAEGHTPEEIMEAARSRCAENNPTV